MSMLILFSLGCLIKYSVEYFIEGVVCVVSKYVGINQIRLTI